MEHTDERICRAFQAHHRTDPWHSANERERSKTADTRHRWDRPDSWQHHERQLRHQQSLVRKTAHWNDEPVATDYRRGSVSDLLFERAGVDRGPSFFDDQYSGPEQLGAEQVFSDHL